MVVLAASIISKSGKALLSRQYVDMSRIRIEGLLAAFPKLVGTEKQHTYIETENVRYVYQPIEALYLLIITNKQSNILDDLETLRLLSKLVPEYSPSLDEESISRAAFELIFAFDEAISLGNKENVTLALVKQYCEMESNEEKLHKLVMQSKENETKDFMRRKVTEIEKSKIDRGKTEKAFGPLRTPNSTDMNTRGDGPGGDLMFDDIHKTKGCPLAPPPASSKVAAGMKLGKAQKPNRFLESLKAEGEVFLEDTQPSAIQSRSSSAPPSDPITVTVEEKLNITVKRDGGVNNFDIQGTLALQVLNDSNGFIQLQIENQDVPGLSFKTHPNISKELFNSQQIVAAKDPNRPFPSGQNETALVKWRIQELNESSLPLAGRLQVLDR
ncbi:hypothetical protein ACP4OV_019755 [Aristida adscensionis]